MKTHSNKDDIYLGKGAGEEILQEIKKARHSVKIVSPYLSGSYVQELIYLHNNGVEVTLITTDKITDRNNKFSDFKNSDLVKKDERVDEVLGRRRKEGMRYSTIGLLFSLILLSFSYFYIIVLMPAIVLIFISFCAILYYFSLNPITVSYEPIFRIRVFDSTSGDSRHSTELIHSKIFVIDEKICFVGSANFTYSGFKKHYETVIRVDDVGAVRDISREVEELYNSGILRVKEVREWM